MKTIYSKLMTVMAIAFMVASCSDDKDEPTYQPGGQDGDVEVTIATTTIQTKAAVLEFGANAQMNIYPKTYNTIDATNIVDGVVATFDGAQWTMSPKVYINPMQKHAFIYAVAPYDPSYTNPKAIPVDLNKQVDLMYSGSFVPASMKTNKVTLKMNHALSLLSFNIVPVNYSGAANLTSISINGDVIYTTGTMNASTGKIVLKDKGEVTASFNQTLKSTGYQNDIPGVWSLPFVTKGGTVTIKAVIDGKTFENKIPEVNVKQGWQYIFRLVLTDSGLEFDPSKTETYSLNVTDDAAPEFTGHGKIVIEASGTWINSPEISGDGVFGTIAAPSGNHSYTGTKKVEGLKTGDQVVVETWNAEGFYIPTLDGVSTIDISDFE